MAEQRPVAYDNMMQQPDVPMADQRASELVALHNLIQDIAQKKIDNCINLPRIYTMVCYGHTDNNAVKAVFPQDIESTEVTNGSISRVICNTSKVMTFPNYSGYNPVIGQGVLILTTGGISPTGGFVIAVMGFPNVFMTGLNSELNEFKQEMQRTVLRIDNSVSDLNTKVDENKTTLQQSIDDLESETNSSMSALENTINSSVTSQINSLSSRISSIERQLSSLSGDVGDLGSLSDMVNELYDAVQPQLAEGTKVFGGASFSQSIVALLADHDQKLSTL